MQESAKLGELTEVTIYATSDEADIENFSMYTKIPAELEIKTVNTDGVSYSSYEEYDFLAQNENFLPKNITNVISVDVTPKKVGEYPIEVTICGRGIYRQERWLTLKVVKK